MLFLALLAFTAGQDFTLPPGQYKATVALALSTKGKVKACKIAQSSGSEEADKTVCKNMKSGQFEPVLDAAGKPIEGTVQQTIRWRVSETE